MTPDEYINIRLKNGKLCDWYRLDNGKRVRTEPHSKALPEDMRYITSYGNTMREFWDNAKSQSSLLWALRGIGRDRTADFIWKVLADKYNLKLHHTVITDDDRQKYADEIRASFECPMEFE